MITQSAYGPVPIIRYKKVKGLRYRAWSVSYAPLGARLSIRKFRTEKEAMAFAVSVQRSPKERSATGPEIPWDITVSPSITPTDSEE